MKRETLERAEEILDEIESINNSRCFDNHKNIPEEMFNRHVAEILAYFDSEIARLEAELEAL